MNDGSLEPHGESTSSPQMCGKRPQERVAQGSPMRLASISRYRHMEGLALRTLVLFIRLRQNHASEISSNIPHYQHLPGPGSSLIGNRATMRGSSTR